MGLFFFYLSQRLVRVCEIELSHMGKNNGNPDLVCEKIFSWGLAIAVRMQQRQVFSNQCLYF